MPAPKLSQICLPQIVLPVGRYKLSVEVFSDGKALTFDQTYLGLPEELKAKPAAAASSFDLVYLVAGIVIALVGGIMAGRAVERRSVDLERRREWKEQLEEDQAAWESEDRF
jgi:hypothetical protein